MSADRLNPTRLFSDPPLTGGAPTDIKFAPGGDFLTYRRPADDDRERMDLWKIDLESGAHTLWIDARSLTPEIHDVSDLTAAERAERERRRQFSHGITQYSWHPDGRRLLLPMDGRALLLDVVGEERGAQWLCPVNTRQSGFQLSPQGTFLSYVRDGDLYLADVTEGAERRITHDASATLKNGLPDFLAAEEMHRFQGHWWSKDERYIVFCKVDDTPVRVSYRLEMEATSARTIEQRYPYAGEANPAVELWLADVGSGECECIWQENSDEVYLARIHTGEQQVVVQTQDRLQQQLHISVYDLAARNWRRIYAETSPTWINLTDDLRLLDGGRLLTTTERTGIREALVLQDDGSMLQLSGPTHINAVLAVTDEIAYASGWDTNATENHLFALRLDGSGCSRLTETPGWHDIVLDTASGRYVDRFTSDECPLSMTVCALDGAAEPVQIHTETIAAGHPYTPYLAAHAYAEFGELTADDGQTLHYRLTPPSHIEGQHATIVYVYGGPGPQKVRREWTPLTVQLFAQNGFGVLELDNRGSGNRGQAFEAPIYRHMGSVEVTDQVRGLAALDGHAWADKTRVGIFGHSYGGYMTLMCLAQASGHFNAGVAVAPVSDWHLYDTHYTERYMGLPADNVDGYAESNVLTHLHKLDAPLLLMHGMADDNVLFTHSTLIMSKLQSLGTPFELMTYPGAKHSMQERDVSIHRFNMILDFFSRHLAPGQLLTTQDEQTRDE